MLIKERDGDVLNSLDTILLLMRVIPDDSYKIANMLGEYEFSRIRIIDSNENRFITVKEATELIGKALPTGEYEFEVKTIKV